MPVSQTVDPLPAATGLSLSEAQASRIARYARHALSRWTREITQSPPRPEDWLLITDRWLALTCGALTRALLWAPAEPAWALTPLAYRLGWSKDLRVSLSEGMATAARLRSEGYMAQTVDAHLFAVAYYELLVRLLDLHPDASLPEDLPDIGPLLARMAWSNGATQHPADRSSHTPALATQDHPDRDQVPESAQWPGMARARVVGVGGREGQETPRGRVGHIALVIEQLPPEGLSAPGPDGPPPDTGHICWLDLTRALPSGDPNRGLAGLLKGGEALHLVLPSLDPSDPEGILCRFVILEPDLLVDVTAVAETLEQNGPRPEQALWHTLTHKPPTASKLIGSVINELLDVLVSEGESFDLTRFLQHDLFQIDPLGLTLLLTDEAQVRELVDTIRHEHLPGLLEAQRMGWRPALLKGSTSPAAQPGADDGPLPGEGDPAPAEALSARHILLEPTFLCPQLGLSGRLDLLYQPPGRPGQYDIIELKSGRPPRQGTWASHRAQALLYRGIMLAQAGFGQPGGRQASGRTAILYARSSEPLRPLASHGPGLAQALWARNVMAGQLCALARARNWAEAHAALGPLWACQSHEYDHTPTFKTEGARALTAALATAPPAIVSWFCHQARFLASERLSARLGTTLSQGASGRQGQAALWRISAQERERQGIRLSGLTLIRTLEGDDHPGGGRMPVLSLQLPDPATGNVLTAQPWTQGDLVLLYPADGGPASAPMACQGQVLRGTIYRYLPHQGLVEVWIRHRQVAAPLLQVGARYHLEADALDHSQTRMMQALGQIATLPAGRRDLLLGLMPPASQDTQARPLALPLDLEVNGPARQALEAAVQAGDYFLITGPPGTGKTAVCLRGLLYHYTRPEVRGKVLVATLTNRALDQVCAQLVALGLDFIRIGSRLGTDPAYHSYLLDVRTAPMRRREELAALLRQVPVIVATASGWQGRPELLSALDYEVALIDEASQLLEAMILPVLAHARRAILIGDGCQLPAVCQIEPSMARIDPADPAARDLSLTDLRTSLFERLLTRCRQQGWAGHEGRLEVQYRCHEQVAAFASRHFYQGQLIPGAAWQRDETLPGCWSGADLWAHLPPARILWVDTEGPSSSGSLNDPKAGRAGGVGMKTCPIEAQLAARAVYGMLTGYIDAHGSAPPARLTVSGLAGLVGVIAPFRAQGALIRHELARIAVTLDPRDLVTEALTQVTVDTVERFQGSERAVIILSMTIRAPWQLAMIQSLTADERVCRKLNVALTRARQRTLILGRASAMTGQPIYASLIDDLASRHAVIPMQAGWLSALPMPHRRLEAPVAPTPF